MSREERQLVAQLKGFPALADCESDDLRALVRAGRVSSVPAGWTFVHEGTPADALYVLLSGSARVRRAGQDRVTRGPGSLVGELGLVDRSLRQADVVADGPVEALRVGYDELRPLVDARPGLAAVLTAAAKEHHAADGPDGP